MALIKIVITPTKPWNLDGLHRLVGEFEIEDFELMTPSEQDTAARDVIDDTLFHSWDYTVAQEGKRCADGNCRVVHEGDPEETTCKYCGFDLPVEK